jgi:hypothetical protein
MQEFSLDNFKASCGVHFIFRWAMASVRSRSSTAILRRVPLLAAWWLFVLSKGSMGSNYRFSVAGSLDLLHNAERSTREGTGRAWWPGMLSMAELAAAAMALGLPNLPAPPRDRALELEMSPPLAFTGSNRLEGGRELTVDSTLPAKQAVRCGFSRPKASFPFLFDQDNAAPSHDD